MPLYRAPVAAPAVAPFSGRNFIRNGDFTVAQRGRGPVTGLGASYSIDGVLATGTGGTFTVASYPVGLGSVGTARWSLTTAVSGQAAVGDYAIFIFPIEDVVRLAGSQVTLSFTANSSVSNIKVGIEVVQAFGTGGSPSPNVLTAIKAIPITTTATRYSTTFFMPSVFGMTLGTDGKDCTQLYFWVSSGSTNAARSSSIGIQNATISFFDIQLEMGSVATPFERLSQQAQLTWCQRYLWRATGHSSYGRYGVGVALNTTQATTLITFPMQMRAAPTFGYSNVGHFIAYNGTATPILTAMAMDTSSPYCYDLLITFPAATAAGQAIQLCQNATNPSFIEFTAEL
jgi:hypothetical protein